MAELNSALKNLLRIPAYTLCGPVLYDQLQFFRANGYWPDYKNPHSFNEKTGRLKLYAPPRDIEILTNKGAVRGIVKARVGEGILNEVYYIGDRPEAILWERLPPRFIAKGTHGSGNEFLIRVTDKNKISFEEFRAQARRILKRSFGRLSNEPWYQKIPPQIMIEKYLDDETYAVAPDYKFMVFHGRARLICIFSNRFVDTRQTVYDQNWQRQPFTMKYDGGPDFPRPPNLEEMITTAEKLAAGYDFLRVDLYNVRNKIVFGELTPCYGAGWERFKPNRSYDDLVGSYW